MTTDKPDLLKDIQRRIDDIDATRIQMLETAQEEERNLTPEEEAQFANLKTDAERLRAREGELIEMAEQRHIADERRARYQAATEPDVELVRVRSEPLTYDRGTARQHSYFADLIKNARGGDFDANERLQRHAREVKAVAESRVREGREEFRDLTRVDGAGGQFVPPIYLVDQYAPLARAARATVDILNPQALPGGTDSINIPAVTTGTATAIQTADNAAVQETDLVDANLAAPVRTIAGQQDVAVQLLEQSPLAFDQIVFQDLIADYNTKFDIQVLSGSGTSGQITGIRTVSGSNAVTYTDATPTVPEIYAKIADAIQQIHTGRFMPPTHILMHPRRWAWFTAALDSQNRPLVVPTANNPMNAVSPLTVASQGQVGTLQGLPVIVDPSLPINLGAGVNEDVILIIRATDMLLWESTMRTRVLPDVGSGTLTTRLQVYAYVAGQFARYPKSISTVGGTGLVSPTF